MATTSSPANKTIYLQIPYYFIYTRFLMAGSEQTGLSPDGIGLNGMTGVHNYRYSLRVPYIRYHCYGIFQATLHRLMQPQRADLDGFGSKVYEFSVTGLSNE